MKQPVEAFNEREQAVVACWLDALVPSRECMRAEHWVECYETWAPLAFDDPSPFTNARFFKHFEQNTAKPMLDRIVRVIFEVELIETRGVRRPWAHASFSRLERIPSYEDLQAVKAFFLGDLRAIQVFPPAAEYVNQQPFVLHLYAPLGHNPLPDFRHSTLGGI